MGAGNGTEPRRVRLTPEWLLPEHQPISATEREQQRIAYTAAVDNMARTLREMVPVVDGILRRAAALSDRVDALERAELVRRSASFMARLRGVFRGR